MKQKFDVIIVGAGHAGVEAAYAAANVGVSVALITKNINDIGETSCNPAIGGIGKTHIVKEIDTFYGLMPQAADRAAIHYRTLNKKKGKAVQATRVQIDKALYKKAVKNILAEKDNITIIYDEVCDLILDDNNQIKSVCVSRETFDCHACVITTGTFLSGTIHLGAKKIPAGRFNSQPANALNNFFKKYNFDIGRLKTGTPARIDGRTVDWQAMALQYSDPNPEYVSRETSRLFNQQVSCGITYTNKETHKIIQRSLHLSSVYSGQIGSSGPRYCPSIEDKVNKFPDKEEHQIFVEPESLTSVSVYPNGISTSLPENIQDAYLRSIKGFEHISILRYGYAIEYNYINPQELYHTLETRKIKGLFLAGQINGTTGYEEAAGQGVWAGINAALSVSRETLVLPRSKSYIGVMVDDLVTKGIIEPYRMFTSRSEFRTLLRTDNSHIRLGDIADRIYSHAKKINAKIVKEYYYIKHYAQSKQLTTELAKQNNLPLQSDGKISYFYTLLGNPIYAEHIKGILSEIDVSRETLETLFNDGLYQHYTQRLVDFAQDVNDLVAIKIPKDFDFKSIKGLSKEILEAVEKKNPINLSDIKLLPSMTPSAMMMIAKYFKK
ncbi:MAG: tRNA uridine 5-carboxymethylaminomethyl modification enzyme [Alphaproteobacteria bacterium]